MDLTENAGELTWRDHAVVYALGAGVSLLSWLSGNNAEVPPGLWEEVAAAIGLRPPATIFPGFWRIFTALLVNCVGIGGGLVALRGLGAVSLGMLLVLSFQMFDEVLPETLRMRMRRKGWSRRIVRFILLQGAVFFVCSDPVWRAGQIFSPTILLLLVTLAAARLFLHAMRTQSRGYAVAMSAVLGLLAAETPFGFLPMFAFPLVVIWRVGSSTSGDVPMANPLVRVITFRRMSVAFAVG